MSEADVLVFAGEVRRVRMLVRNNEMRAMDASRHLQILWRQLSGMTMGDGGIADGTMYGIVVNALKGTR
jgi:hypothetical protein